MLPRPPTPTLFPYTTLFRARQVVEPPDHLEVLEAGEVLVDRRVLACEPYLRAERIRVAHNVEPGHPRLPRIGLEQRRQDPDGGGLAGPVRAEQAEDAAGRH